MENKLLISARKIWKIINKEITIDVIEVHKERMEYYKNILNIFSVGEYYYLLFNVVNEEIEYISDEETEVLGYQPRELNLQVFFNSIHPDDKAFFLKFEQNIVSFVKLLPLEEYPNYKMQYDLRIKTKNAKYKRILIQYILVNYDEINIYHSFHIHTDITHIKPSGEPCFSIIGINGRPSYRNISSDIFTDNKSSQNDDGQKFFTKSFDLFTKSERKILKGIIEGKTSQQIAKELFISYYTVNAHRRNILQKAEVNNLVELVAKTLREGWI